MRPFDQGLIDATCRDIVTMADMLRRQEAAHCSEDAELVLAFDIALGRASLGLDDKRDPLREHCRTHDDAWCYCATLIKCERAEMRAKRRERLERGGWDFTELDAEALRKQRYRTLVEHAVNNEEDEP